MEQQVEIGSLMNRSVVTARVDSLLYEVVHLMVDNRVSCVIIVEANAPVGIITERDLVGELSKFMDGKGSLKLQAKDFMTASPVLIKQSTPLFEALVVTQSHRIRHLPVVDDSGTLCGILSYTNLAHAYEHLIEQQREIIEQEVSFETKRLRDVNEQLKALSMEDALLEIGNRRSMEVDLCYTHSMALRYMRPYSIALFDVDFFKKYNDHYGHQAGDEALKLVTDHIRGEIRTADRLYRYGGEELLLLMPETEPEGANITSQRIVHELAERNIPHAKSELGILTISGGVASIELTEGCDPNWRSLVDIADKQLYQAKQNGRNRVTTAPLSESPIETQQAAVQS